MSGIPRIDISPREALLKNERVSYAHPNSGAVAVSAQIFHAALRVSASWYVAEVVFDEGARP